MFRSEATVLTWTTGTRQGQPRKGRGQETMSTDIFENETHYPDYSGSPESNELEALLESEDDIDYSDDAEDDIDADGKPAKSTNKSSNRALIRKVAAKAEELASAPTKDKDLLAHLLGSGTATADLTVAVITATRTSLVAVADLKEISEQYAVNQMQAMVVAIGIGRNRQKALWSLLVHLGKLTGKPNASESKAAMDIATAISTLDKSQHSALDRALALAKR